MWPEITRDYNKLPDWRRQALERRSDMTKNIAKENRNKRRRMLANGDRNGVQPSVPGAVASHIAPAGVSATAMLAENIADNIPEHDPPTEVVSRLVKAEEATKANTSGLPLSPAKYSAYLSSLPRKTAKSLRGSVVKEYSNFVNQVSTVPKPPCREDRFPDHVRYDESCGYICQKHAPLRVLTWQAIRKRTMNIELLIIITPGPSFLHNFNMGASHAEHGGRHAI